MLLLNLTDGDDDDNEGNLNDEANDNKQAKKKSKKRMFKKGIKNTIVKDASSVIDDFQKLESSSFKKSMSSEDNGPAGLFTNCLPLDYAGNKFLLWYGTSFVFI